MRKSLVIPAVGLLVAGVSSAFWMVSAADPAATVRMTVDVPLAKDSDFLSGFVPSRTTIAHLFQNHMIHTADAQVLVSSIASAIDVRKLRAGQPYAIDPITTSSSAITPAIAASGNLLRAGSGAGGGS